MCLKRYIHRIEHLNFKKSSNFIIFYLFIGFEFTSTSTEEPSGGESRTIQLPIIRTGGTLGVVTVNWEARLNGNLDQN